VAGFGRVCKQYEQRIWRILTRLIFHLYRPKSPQRGAIHRLSFVIRPLPYLNLMQTYLQLTDDHAYDVTSITSDKWSPPVY
jgi:hypothetical protein